MAVFWQEFQKNEFLAEWKHAFGTSANNSERMAAQKSSHVKFALNTQWGAR